MCLMLFKTTNIQTFKRTLQNMCFFRHFRHWETFKGEYEKSKNWTYLLQVEKLVVQKLIYSV